MKHIHRYNDFVNETNKPFEPQGEMVNESIADLWHALVQLWNDTSYSSDLWGTSEITNGAAFRTAVYTILGNIAFFSIAFNWDKLKSKVSQFSKLVDMFKGKKASDPLADDVKQKLEAELKVNINEETVEAAKTRAEQEEPK